MIAMRSTVPVRTAKIGCLILSVLIMAAGIFLVVRPDIGEEVIGLAAGILILAFGIFKIIGYLSRDLFRLAFEYDLAFGILLVILGIVILARPQQVMGSLSLMLGITIAMDSLLKVQIAINAKPFGIRWWWMILAAALPAGLLGVIMILRPAAGAAALTVLFGLALFMEGLLNLVTILLTVKIAKNLKEDIKESRRRPYSQGPYIDL